MPAGPARQTPDECRPGQARLASGAARPFRKERRFIDVLLRNAKVNRLMVKATSFDAVSLSPIV